LPNKLEEKKLGKTILPPPAQPADKNKKTSPNINKPIPKKENDY
jgi:hypothetical protein